MAGIMEGINSKSDRKTLMSRLQEADEQMTKIQKIAQVRRKWLATNPQEQHSVVITASEQDWLEALEFLHDLRDVAPEALVRLYNGGRTMFSQQIADSEEGGDGADSTS